MIIKRGEVKSKCEQFGCHAPVQILSSHKISSLQYTFSIILHAENSLLAHLPALLINVLVGQNDDEPRKQQNGNRSLEGYTRGPAPEKLYI